LWPDAHGAEVRAIAANIRAEVDATPAALKLTEP
jgi:hypothetical protein